jgi:hypothetical protein
MFTAPSSYQWRVLNSDQWEFQTYDFLLYWLLNYVNIFLIMILPFHLSGCLQGLQFRSNKSNCKHILNFHVHIDLEWDWSLLLFILWPANIPLSAPTVVYGRLLGWMVVANFPSISNMLDSGMAGGLMDGHWILRCLFNDLCLIAWDCNTVRVQISITLRVATYSLILILTIVESH